MEKFIPIQHRGDKVRGTKEDSGDWVALGVEQEERVPSWVLLYFWASP